MIAPFNFVPRSSPLARSGAAAACVYLGAFVAVAFAFSHPAILAADFVAVIALGLAAGARRSLGPALRFSALLGVLMVATNVIASQRGDTILVRGPELPILGTVDISAEALVEGGILALRVAVVITAFAVFTAAVDPDRLLRLLRPLARRSAMTSTLVIRLVPLAAADHARLSDAAALRGPAASPVSRGAMLRRLVAGSMDRATDVAATLELRGFGGSNVAGGSAPRRSAAPVDLGFMLAGVLVIACAVAILATDTAPYESYPVVTAGSGGLVLAFALALPLLALAPFASKAAR